jgi:predicted amidohydrolase
VPGTTALGAAEEDLAYVGRSSIVAPDATVLDSVERGTRLIYAEINPHLVKAQQKENPYLGDRRAPLYPMLTQNQGNR